MHIFTHTVCPIRSSRRPNSCRYYNRPYHHQPQQQRYERQVITKFIALLSIAQETPTCDETAALGNALATFNRRTKQFCYSLSYIGLSQEVEMFSHIHAPGDIGETGPVIFTLPTGANKAACVKVSNSADEESLMKDLWYFNVHSAECPGGELRGQILKL